MKKRDKERLEFLKTKTEQYFDMCDTINEQGLIKDNKVKKPYTLSGLLYYIDISREEFEQLCKVKCFSPLFTKALSRIEAFTEEYSLIGALSTNAAANSLKYNFGWGREKSFSEEGASKTIKIILDGDLVSLAE